MREINKLQFQAYDGCTLRICNSQIMEQFSRHNLCLHFAKNSGRCRDHDESSEGELLLCGDKYATGWQDHESPTLPFLLNSHI